MTAQADFDAAKKLEAAGKYSEALTLAESALALREAVLGSGHLEVANCLNLLGSLYREQGVYDQAEPLLQRALATREVSLDKNHPDIATALSSLAVLYADQSSYDRAESLYQRALAIQETSLGKSHPDVATSLNGLANVYRMQGAYDRAESLCQRALVIREEVLGKSHPDVANSLYGLASIYKEQGAYGRAESLYQRALAIQEEVLGKSHPAVANSLYNLANIYREQGAYGRAESLYQRALAIKEEVLGKSHPDLAGLLNSIANLYTEQGAYGRAEPLYQRALTIREALGERHPNLAIVLGNLATLYWKQGVYGRAEPLYQRALAIQEQALGKSHPAVAGTLLSLATLYSKQGSYGRAELLYQRALTIREEALGKSHPAVADLLYNLANLYVEQGAYDRAEHIQQRVLAIWEEAFGKNNPRVAHSLNSLACLYADQGEYSRAESLHQRALAIREKAFGKSHPDVASSLNNLADLYRDKGKYGRAESLYQRALAIQEKALGKSHPDVATSLDKLANLYKDQGAYSKAELLYQRALTVREEAFGKNYPFIADLLNHTARLRLAQHRFDEAMPLFVRAFSISETRLRREALDFSESRFSRLLQYLSDNEEMIYSLLRAHSEDARVRRLALGAVLLAKGRSVGETANISRTIYRGMGTEDRSTFDRLRALRTRMAALSLEGPGTLSPTDYRQLLEALVDEGDSLEAQLAQHSAPLRALEELPPLGKIVDRVAATLPKDSVLVEFISYEDSPLVPKPGTPQSKIAKRLRYLALILFPEASISAVDLGPSDPIDFAASTLRDALAKQDPSYLATAQRLERLAFEPLRPFLGGVRRLFLAPDGQLNVVPFAAFHDGKDFLLESFDFTYLTSGRELLTHVQDKAPASSVFILADPRFSTSSASEPGSTEIERSFSVARSDVSRSFYSPLPGTRLEAQSIQHLLPQAQVFLGAEATKERLMHLPTPGILHLATHGFFLGSAPSSPRGFRGVVSSDLAGGSPPPQQEPLLNSGLVLAGTPKLGNPDSHPEPTLVTALELAGLDLWGTQLVVLSACDSGRGDVQSGQGVYGLRRAMVVAGAETVISSLWKVQDDSTSKLMDTYYRNLLAGQGRASALREAMLAFRVSHPHPHDWAPFIALGSDAPLYGIAPIAP